MTEAEQRVREKREIDEEIAQIDSQILQGVGDSSLLRELYLDRERLIQLWERLDFVDLDRGSM